MRGHTVKALKRAYLQLIHQLPDGAPVEMSFRTFKRRVVTQSRNPAPVIKPVVFRMHVHRKTQCRKNQPSYGPVIVLHPNLGKPAYWDKKRRHQQSLVYDMLAHQLNLSIAQISKLESSEDVKVQAMFKRAHNTIKSSNDNRRSMGRGR